MRGRCGTNPAGVDRVPLRGVSRAGLGRGLPRALYCRAPPPPDYGAGGGLEHKVCVGSKVKAYVAAGRRLNLSLLFSFFCTFTVELKAPNVISAETTRPFRYEKNMAPNSGMSPFSVGGKTAVVTGAGGGMFQVIQEIGLRRLTREKGSTSHSLSSSSPAIATSSSQTSPSAPKQRPSSPATRTVARHRVPSSPART